MPYKTQSYTNIQAKHWKDHHCQCNPCPKLLYLGDPMEAGVVNFLTATLEVV